MALRTLIRAAAPRRSVSVQMAGQRRRRAWTSAFSCFWLGLSWLPRSVALRRCRGPSAPAHTPEERKNTARLVSADRKKERDRERREREREKAFNSR